MIEKVKFYIRSIHYLVMRWIVRKAYMEAYVPYFNFRFKFKTEDVVGRLLFKHQTFEPGITHCFLNNISLEADDVVLDIGANIGWFSILFDNHSPSSVSIYAFEPDPLNFQLLTTNVEKNKARKVTCLQKAVSDKVETKTLYQYPSKNRGRHSLLPINSGEKTEVETTTLDDFIRENDINPDRVKFVKIDVEGYEHIVLKGGHTLLAHLPMFHTEFSPAYMKKGGLDTKQFIDYVMGYQFDPYLIDTEGNLYQISYDQLIERQGGADILWVKKGYPLKTI